MYYIWSKNYFALIYLLELIKVSSICKLCSFDLCTPDCQCHLTLIWTMAKVPGHMTLWYALIATKWPVRSILSKSSSALQFNLEQVHFIQSPFTLRPGHSNYPPSLSLFVHCNSLSFSKFYLEMPHPLSRTHFTWYLFLLVTRLATI